MYENEKQREVYLALGRLLTRAAQADLPPVSWTVSYAGTLVGRIRATRPRAELQETYDRWVAFLGPDARHEPDRCAYASNEVTKAASFSNAPGMRDMSVLLEVHLDDAWEKFA